MDLEKAVSITAALCRHFEGLYLKPYLCPAGVATIGYGSTHYENGVRVTLFDPPITKERAEALLMWMVRNKYLPQAIKLCPGVDTPERAGAVGDFGFNLGTGNLKSSTLRRKVNERDWEAAVEQILRWDKAGGKRLRGLTRRRQAEAALLP
jgi:lysozyme